MQLIIYTMHILLEVYSYEVCYNLASCIDSIVYIFITVLLTCKHNDYFHIFVRFMECK